MLRVVQSIAILPVSKWQSRCNCDVFPNIPEIDRLCFPDGIEEALPSSNDDAATMEPANLIVLLCGQLA